jgi:hypothetical protein
LREELLRSFHHGHIARTYASKQRSVIWVSFHPDVIVKVEMTNEFLLAGIFIAL